MFLQDSKEGRKREHINNICARERKGPEGKLVRVSIRGKKEGKKTEKKGDKKGKKRMERKTKENSKNSVYKAFFLYL